MRDDVDAVNDPQASPGRTPGNRPALLWLRSRSSSDGDLMRKKHYICFGHAIVT